MYHFNYQKDRELSFSQNMGMSTDVGSSPPMISYRNRRQQPSVNAFDLQTISHDENSIASSLSDDHTNGVYSLCMHEDPFSKTYVQSAMREQFIECNKNLSLSCDCRQWSQAYAFKNTPCTQSKCITEKLVDNHLVNFHALFMILMEQLTSRPLPSQFLFHGSRASAWIYKLQPVQSFFCCTYSFSVLLNGNGSQSASDSCSYCHCH